MAAALDIELVELARWNCCGGVSVASMSVDALESLGRRNLAQVPPAGARQPDAGAREAGPESEGPQALKRSETESEGPEAPKRSETELFCPCPHCYTNLARAAAAAPASPGGDATVELRNVLDIFAREEVLARLVERRTEPLTDLRMVAYYGCKLLRPDPEAASLRRAGEEEAPPSPPEGFGATKKIEQGEVLAGKDTSVCASSPAETRSEEKGAGTFRLDGRRPLERLIEACGATVAEWPAGGDCCGAALGVAQPEVADELLGRVFLAALAAGAEAIVVACPLCHLNLDLRQYQVSQRLGRGVDIPIFFVTELMAVALGMEESEDWLERHVTSPLPTFMRWMEAQEEREYWGEKGPPGKEESPPASAPSDTVEAAAATGAPGATSAGKQADGEAPTG